MMHASSGPHIAKQDSCTQPQRRPAETELNPGQSKLQRLEEKPSAAGSVNSVGQASDGLAVRLENFRGELNRGTINLSAAASWIQHCVDESLCESNAALFAPVIIALTLVIVHKLSQFDKQQQYGEFFPLDELRSVASFVDGMVERCRSLSNRLFACSCQLQSTVNNAIKKIEEAMKAASTHRLPNVRKGTRPAKGKSTTVPPVVCSSTVSSGGTRARVIIQPGMYSAVAPPPPPLRRHVSNSHYHLQSEAISTASRQHPREHKVNMNNPWARDISFTQDEYPYIERTLTLVPKTEMKNDLKTAFTIEDDSYNRIHNGSESVIVCLNSSKTGAATCLSSFRHSIVMYVNEQCVSFPEDHKKRRHGPPPELAYGVNVTIQCRNSINEIRFHADTFDDEMKDLTFSVFVTRKRTIDDLCSLCPKLPESECRSHVQEVLKGDGGEVSVVCSKVSIKCPLSLARIQIPARSRNCSHVQCFDLGCFLEVNAHTPRFICPVCNGKAPFSSLIIDSYFLSILNSIEDDDINEVEFDPNGTWKAGVWGDDKEQDDGDDDEEIVVQHDLNEEELVVSYPVQTPIVESPSEIIILDDD